MGIRLSKEHGVNPALGECMWCGEPTGEIAMLGRLKGDAKAPKHIVLSYKPCDKCKEVWSQGVALIECTPNEFEDGRPPFTKDDYGEPLYPTGRLFVIKAEAVSKMCGTDCKVGDVLAVSEAVYSALNNRFEDTERSEDDCKNHH